MINLKFKRECFDKDTGEKYKEGDIKEFSEERANAIIAVKGGFYAEVAEVAEDGAPEGKDDEPADDTPEDGASPERLRTGER